MKLTWIIHMKLIQSHGSLCEGVAFSPSSQEREAGGSLSLVYIVLGWPGLQRNPVLEKKQKKSESMSQYFIYCFTKNEPY